MKISSKGRYGLRSMVDLVAYSSGDHVSLGSISERQNISENYLGQVFSVLRKAGIVKSVKGAQGGYVLADTPSNVKVGDILRALEGNVSVADESFEDDQPISQKTQTCLKVNVWDKINESIDRVVDSLTLQDLVDEFKKMEEKDTEMYYI